MRTKRARYLACLAVLLASVLSGAVAMGASLVVGGNLSRDGLLVQYPTYRTHTFTGPINMYLTNNTINYTRLGLRDTAGKQFTHSEQWDSVPNGKNFALTSNGSINIPSGTKFAINGRMGATIWPLDNYWEGTLNY